MKGKELSGITDLRKTVFFLFTGSTIHAVDCIYHHVFSVNFGNGYDKLLIFQTKMEVKHRKYDRSKDQNEPKKTV